MDLVLLKMGRFSKKMVSFFAKSGCFAAWAACCDVFRQDGGSSSFLAVIRALYLSRGLF